MPAEPPFSVANVVIWVDPVTTAPSVGETMDTVSGIVFETLKAISADVLRKLSESGSRR